MGDIGLRELRQNASHGIRRVEAGEMVVVTVSGRAAARLVPFEDRRWRTWAQVSDVFDGPDVSDLANEIRDRRGEGEVEAPRDPFGRVA